MQAWFNLVLAGIGLGPECGPRQDTKNGEAKPATAAARRNWRRDHGVGAAWGEADFIECKGCWLSFIPADWMCRGEKTSS